MENQTTETSTNGVHGAPEMTRMLSEAQVRTILDNVEKESPERWPAAVKTLVVTAFAEIERINVAMPNLVAAIAEVGSDLSAHKVEYGKLLESHKRLAVVTSALQSEVRALKPVSSTAMPAGETPSVVETPGTETPTSGTRTTPGDAQAVSATEAPIPQDAAEALMDAAIATAQTGSENAPFVEPSIASPTAGGRRRNR